MKLVQRRPNRPMQIAAQCAGRVVFFGKKHHLVGKGADALALRAGTEITRLPIKNYASHSRVILLDGAMFFQVRDGAYCSAQSGASGGGLP